MYLEFAVILRGFTFFFSSKLLFFSSFKILSLITPLWVQPYACRLSSRLPRKPKMIFTPGFLGVIPKSEYLIINSACSGYFHVPCAMRLQPCMDFSVCRLKRVKKSLPWSCQQSSSEVSLHPLNGILYLFLKQFLLKLWKLLLDHMGLRGIFVTNQ